MKTTLVTQPFDADDNSLTLGNLIISFLGTDEPFYGHIWIISAFANQQAIKHLEPHLKRAIERHAEISIIVGFDHQSTSIEALRALLDLNVDVKVAHNKRPGHTFHPKIYLFEGEDAAELVVGSHNLTEGGLFTNYEASVQLSFNLQTDEKEYNEAKNALARFLNPPQDIVQPLSEDLIEYLIERGEIVSEKVKREATKSKSAASSAAKPIPPSRFGTELIERPARAEVKKRASIQKEPSLVAQGKLVWEKQLSATDAQRQTGNKTGDLRLTQAGWEVDGHLIDHTQYFRFEVFGELEWETGKLPNQELARGDFSVEIMSSLYGMVTLEITHKPSGEANQGNYTTALRWGELSVITNREDLTGKTFRLYAPIEGSNIFTIVII